MKPLTTEQKIVLQNTSWKLWCTNLIKRRFYNIHDGERYAIIGFDEHPYVITLYEREGWIERLYAYIRTEGYGK